MRHYNFVHFFTQAEFASALRHCLTYSNLGDLLPTLTRSNSAPDILSLVESTPKQKDKAGTSPRSLAISVKEQSSHGPSSYKETSELEKKYQEAELDLRRESLDYELKEISELNQEKNARDESSEVPSTVEVKKDTIAPPVQVQPRFRRHTVGNEPGNHRSPLAMAGMLPPPVEGQVVTEHSVSRTVAPPSHITITQTDGQVTSIQADQQQPKVQINVQSTQNEPQSTQSERQATQNEAQSTQSNQSNQPNVVVQPPTTKQQQPSQTGQQPAQSSQPSQQQSDADATQIGQTQDQQSVTPSKDGNLKPMQRPRGHTVAGSMLAQASQRGQRGFTSAFTNRDAGKSGGLSPR